MATVISFANQKGGVAKTTSGMALGQILCRANRKVLFIDMDSQGNLSHSLRADPAAATVWDVLTKEKTVSEAAQHTQWGDCLCFSNNLTGADKKLDVIGKEYLLKEALEPAMNQYAYIIIDPPPALGILTVNSLAASNYVVIPSQADMYSLIGISQIFSTIESIKKYCNPGLKIAGILITRFNGQTNISREISQMMEESAQKLNTKVFKARIRECVAVKEAEAGQTALFSHTPKSIASADYCEFIKEFIRDLNADKKH
jgi:chromosome partitioning protein